MAEAVEMLVEVEVEVVVQQDEAKLSPTNCVHTVKDQSHSRYLLF